MRRIAAIATTMVFLASCASSGRLPTQSATVQKQKANPSQESASDGVSFADVVGTIIFGPPALVTHIFWAIYGVLAYPIAAIDRDPEQVPLIWSGQIGSDYVSSKFLRHWAYYGNEPSKPISAFSLKEGDRLPRSEPLLDITADLTFAPFGESEITYNMRGNETRPLKLKGEQRSEGEAERY